MKQIEELELMEVPVSKLKFSVGDEVIVKINSRSFYNGLYGVIEKITNSKDFPYLVVFPKVKDGVLNNNFFRETELKPVTKLDKALR